MKKHIIGLLMMVIVVPICLYFMGFFLRPSTVVLENLIPDNTAAVAIIDVEAIAKEAGLTLQPKKMRKLHTGIDFGKPIYVYLTESAYLGLAASLVNYRDLEDNLDDVRRSGDFTWGTKDGLLVCHDNSRVLMFGLNLSWNDKRAQKEMADLMNKQGTASILFDDLRKQNGAFRAKISLEKIISIFVQDDMQEIQKGLSADVDSDADIDVASITMDFVGKTTSNSIALSALLTSPDKRTNEILDGYKKKLRHINHELDAHIPQSPTMWMCMNVDGSVVQDALMKNKAMASQMNMINQFINVSDILKYINGDVLFVLGDVSQSNMDMGLAMQVDNTKFLTPQLMQTLDVLDIHVGKYEVKSNKSIYCANTSSMEQSMSSGGFLIDKAGGYGDGCVCYISVDANKAMQAVKPIASVSDEISPILAFVEQNVDRANLRVTRDTIECKLIFNSTINDYVSKWIE